MKKHPVCETTWDVENNIGRFIATFDAWVMWSMCFNLVCLRDVRGVPPTYGCGRCGETEKKMNDI